MRKTVWDKGISQEGLKLIACAAMLADHIGAVLLPQWGWLRIIGRISFPIFCFTLVEGFLHTCSLKRYLLRLAAAAVISERPFDLAFYGHWSMMGQNVMWTLLLGCGMLALMERSRHVGKLLAILLFAALAQLLRTDYGGYGVLTVALFALTRGKKWRWLVQGIGLALIGIAMGGMTAVGIPIQVWSAAALIPICGYRGKKRGHSKPIQWLFYLFYPAHLLALYLI